MKKILMLTVIFATLLSCESKQDKDQGREKGVLRIHNGKYAFCGASAAVPTGKKITIQGVEFDEGCAICPVLDGPSISSLAMHGEGSLGVFNPRNNFQTPDGTSATIWSLFWYFGSSDTIPQFNQSTKKWEWMAPVNRSFKIDMSKPATSESDMFQMPGVVIDTLENGIILAKCYGPLNHMALPLRKPFSTQNGQTSVTAAPIGSPYPVGTPIPVMELSKDIKNKQK